MQSKLETSITTDILVFSDSHRDERLEGEMSEIKQHYEKRYETHWK